MTALPHLPLLVRKQRRCGECLSARESQSPHWEAGIKEIVAMARKRQANYRRDVLVMKQRCCGEQIISSKLLLPLHSRSLATSLGSCNKGIVARVRNKWVNYWRDVLVMKQRRCGEPQSPYWEAGIAGIVAMARNKQVNYWRGVLVRKQR